MSGEDRFFVKVTRTEIRKVLGKLSKRQILTLLAARSVGWDGTIAGNKRIERECGLNRQNVKKALQDLQIKGVIEWRTPGGEEAKTILEGESKRLPGGGVKTTPPHLIDHL